MVVRKNSQNVSSAPDYLKYRYELVKWGSILGTCNVAFFLIYGIITQGNYIIPMEFALPFLLVGWILTIRRKINAGAANLLIGLTLISILQGLLQHSAYAMCILAVTLIGLTIVLPRIYITIFFIVDCAIIGVFLALGELTWLQVFPPGYDIALVNNVQILLAILITAYVIAQIIARVIIEPMQKSAELLESKSHLITFASHELKTPLVPIFGWANLMAEAKKKGLPLDDVFGTPEIESIQRNAERLNELIEKFLLVGISERGPYNFVTKTVNLHALVSDALDAVSTLVKKNSISIDTHVPDMQINVDPFRIEQVLVNLLTNAIKYSPPSSPVTITAVMDPDMVEIVVQDRGTGLTHEELQDAFRPFSRSFLQKKAESGIAGNGVGLYLCKNFVEQHGGRITIESPGRNLGATVKIHLPRYP